eukprot:SM000305S11813  [mRNA]  locus=s305:105721:115819:- [translate_table: standard]
MRLTCLAAVLVFGIACVGADRHICGHDEHVISVAEDFLQLRDSSLANGFGTNHDNTKNHHWRHLDELTIPPISNLAPIRITPIPVILEDLAGETQLLSYLLDDLLPQAFSFLGRLLQVKEPIAGPLRLPPVCAKFAKRTRLCTRISTTCDRSLQLNFSPNLLDAYTVCPSGTNESCQAVPAGSGYQGTDFVLYVTSKVSSVCNGGAMAHASYCALDSLSHRPLAGYLNFCPANITSTWTSDPRQHDLMLVVVLHELTHALGFSAPLYKYFRDIQGKPYSEVVLESEVHGSNSSVIVTPHVVAAAREQFGCSSLMGAGLAPGTGLDGSTSHWDPSIMGNDYMSSQVGGRATVVSNITLALLQDTGWYNVDLAMAGFLTNGFHSGCTFVNATCNNPNAVYCLQVLPAHCRQISALLQTYNVLTAQLQAKCRIIIGSYIHATTCELLSPPPWQNTYCSADYLATTTCGGSNDSLAVDGCLLKQDIPSRQCQSSQDRSCGQTFGLFSRCFQQRYNDWNLSAAGPKDVPIALCFKTNCSWLAGQDPILQVLVAGTWIKCKDSKFVTLPSGQRFGPCPLASDICRGAICPDDCSLQGQCDAGVCRCSPGYAGLDCSMVACSPFNASSCTDGTSCHLPSGLCQRSQVAQAPSPAPLSSAIPPAFPPPSPQPVPSSPQVALVSEPPPPSPIPGGLITSSTFFVQATIHFADLSLMTMVNNNYVLSFKGNFTREMIQAVRNAGYTGVLQVSVDSLREGSVIVDCTTSFLQACSFSTIDAFAQLLRTNPGKVFGSASFFNPLAEGSVTSLRVRIVQGAQLYSAPRSSGGLATAYIVLIVLGSAGAIAAVISFVWCLKHAKQARQLAEASDPFLQARWPGKFSGVLSNAYTYADRQSDHETSDVHEAPDFDPTSAYAELMEDARRSARDQPVREDDHFATTGKVSMPAMPERSPAPSYRHGRSRGALAQTRASSGPLLFSSEELRPQAPPPLRPPPPGLWRASSTPLEEGLPPRPLPRGGHRAWSMQQSDRTYSGQLVPGRLTGARQPNWASGHTYSNFRSGPLLYSAGSNLSSANESDYLPYTGRRPSGSEVLYGAVERSLSGTLTSTSQTPKHSGHADVAGSPRLPPLPRIPPGRYQSGPISFVTSSPDRGSGKVNASSEIVPVAGPYGRGISGPLLFTSSSQYGWYGSEQGSQAGSPGPQVQSSLADRATHTLAIQETTLPDIVID